MRDDHGPPRLGPGHVLDDRQHGGDARPRAGQQQQGVLVADHEITGRGADVEHVADLGLVVEVGRDLAVGGAVLVAHFSSHVEVPKPDPELAPEPH